MWFKLAFVTIFLGAATVATRAARRATARHGGPLNQLRHEARGLIVVRSVLGVVFYTALVGWLFDIRALAWAQVPLSTWMRWLAVALLVPVLAFFAWSFGALGTNYRGGVGLYDAHELVTTGPYRVMRHPIYAAFIAIMVLVFLLSANWVLGLSGLLLVVSIAAMRIPTEERELYERFGSTYASYRDKTGRLVPRVGWVRGAP